MESLPLNWDAIGAVAELGGALAVIATLVYLGLQIKQSSAIARADLYQSAQTAFSSWRSMANANAQVMSKMSEPENLSSEELVVAINIASELAFAYAMLFENYKIIAPDKMDTAITGSLTFFTAYPEFYSVAREQMLSNGFSEFVKLLDQRREQGGT